MNIRHFGHEPATTASLRALRVLKPTVLAVAMGCVGSTWAASGGLVVNGAGKVATSGATTTVTQSSDKMVVNWNNFDIAQGETVTFAQPGASSAVLNRVTGTVKATDIQGSLNANGRVYVVNPAGVMFGSTAVVNADSVVASTLEINAQQFMAGGRTAGNQKVLDLASGATNAAVVNQGRINARQIALLGGQVLNKGQINATGDVTLGAADSATLTLGGSGFSIALGGAEVNALVDNGGVIVSRGGNVRLTAAATGDALRNAVRSTGTLEARRATTGAGGAIELRSDADGQLDIGGKLVADNSIYADTTPRIPTGKGRSVVVEPLAQLQAHDIAINALGTLTSSGNYAADNLTLAGDKVVVNTPVVNARQVNVYGNQSVTQKANITADRVSLVGNAIEQTTGVVTRGGAIELSGHPDTGVVKASMLDGLDVRVTGHNVTFNGDVNGKYGIDVRTGRNGGGTVTALKSLVSGSGDVNVDAMSYGLAIATPGKVVTRGVVNGNRVNLLGDAVEVYAAVTGKDDVMLAGTVAGVRQQANVASAGGSVMEQGGAIVHAAGVTTTAAQRAEFRAVSPEVPAAFNLGGISARDVLVDNAAGAVSLNGAVSGDGSVQVNAGNGTLTTAKTVQSRYGMVGLNANNVVANGAIDGALGVYVGANRSATLAGPVTSSNDVQVHAGTTITQKGDITSTQGNVMMDAATIDQAATSKTTAANAVYLNGTVIRSGVITAGNEIALNGGDVTLGGTLTSRHVSVPANAKNTAGNIVVTEPQPQPEQPEWQPEPGTDGWRLIDPSEAKPDVGYPIVWIDGRMWLVEYI